MKPKYGRLNNHLAWCTEEPHSSWLVVNLGHVALVTGIATQGYRTLFNHYYVKKYQIQHSMDGSNWSYIETNGSIKVNTNDMVINGFKFMPKRSMGRNHTAK